MRVPWEPLLAIPGLVAVLAAGALLLRARFGGVGVGGWATLAAAAVAVLLLALAAFLLGTALLVGRARRTPASRARLAAEALGALVALPGAVVAARIAYEVGNPLLLGLTLVAAAAAVAGLAGVPARWRDAPEHG